MGSALWHSCVKNKWSVWSKQFSPACITKWELQRQFWLLPQLRCRGANQVFVHPENCSCWFSYSSKSSNNLQLLAKAEWLPVCTSLNACNCMFVLITMENRCLPLLSIHSSQFIGLPAAQIDAKVQLAFTIGFHANLYLWSQYNPTVLCCMQINWNATCRELSWCEKTCISISLSVLG